jgi:hypothetical protein
MYLDDVWIVIEGYSMNARAALEVSRIGWWYIAAFGNSDKRKLARSLHKFHPFDWDEVEKLSAKEIIERAQKNKEKYLKLKKKQDGGNTQS